MFLDKKIFSWLKISVLSYSFLISLNFSVLGESFFDDLTNFDPRNKNQSKSTIIKREQEIEAEIFIHDLAEKETRAKRAKIFSTKEDNQKQTIVAVKALEGISPKQYQSSKSYSKAGIVYSNSSINRYVELWSSRSYSTTIKSGFQRFKDSYQRIVLHKLKNAGIPEHFAFLPVIESAYSERALSNKGALGIWQLMCSVVKDHTIGAYCYQTSNAIHLSDIRLDTLKSTDIAIRQILKLYSSYYDWDLVLAAYNSGKKNVDRALAKYNAKKQDPRTNAFCQDYKFWCIRGFLPKETQEYIPKFYAVSILSKNFL